MANSITVKEINRFSKLLKGKNPPYRIMYGGKEVQYLAKGNEMVNEYVDYCNARWQKGYKKIVPSVIYSNNFNYLLFSAWRSPSTVSSDKTVWSNLYKYRHTIESTITTDTVTNKNIVPMMNGYSLGYDYNPHLSICYPSYYEKFRAMQHDKYCYSYREFIGTTEDSTYPTSYRDTRFYSGYSICKEFLNSTNAFSIELNFGLAIEYTGIYTSQSSYTPIIMLKIYDPTWQTVVKSFNTTNRYCNASTTDLRYTYQYKDFFNEVELSTGSMANPDDPYGKNKLYTAIQEDGTRAAIENVHGKNLAGFATEAMPSIFTDYTLYPHVNLVLTCDKQTLSLYTNGELYKSTDIGQYLVDGNQLFDIDIMFDRDVTMDTNGIITSQTAKYTPIGKLYSLQVYNECLTAEQVGKVFRETEKYLPTADYWKHEHDEYPSEVQERVAPTLIYEAGPNTEFDPDSAYFVLLWKYWNTQYEAAYYSRYENITKNIQWTFDNLEVFQTGGTTIAHASYTVRNFTWSKDYTITVTST